MSPGKIIQSVEREGERVGLEAVNLNIDYEQIRDNIEWKIKTVMNRKDFQHSPAMCQQQKESGVKRAMDEIELEERGMSSKETLYNFEIDLI